MLLFIASKLYFFFLPTLAVPGRLGQAALSLHLLVCTLCGKFTPPQSKKAARFWTPTGVKRRCSCGCVRLWNLKSFSVSEGSTDKTGKRSSLCLSFVFQLKSKDAAHFICPQSACSCFGGGLQRCEPWSFTAHCCNLFHWKAVMLHIQGKK